MVGGSRKLVKGRREAGFVVKSHALHRRALAGEEHGSSLRPGDFLVEYDRSNFGSPVVATEQPRSGDFQIAIGRVAPGLATRKSPLRPLHTLVGTCRFLPPIPQAEKVCPNSRRTTDLIRKNAHVPF